MGENSVEHNAEHTETMQEHKKLRLMFISLSPWCMLGGMLGGSYSLSIHQRSALSIVCVLTMVLTLQQCCLFQNYSYSS